jgi:hypothetical protein
MTAKPSRPCNHSDTREWSNPTHWEIENIPDRGGRVVQVILKKCKSGPWEFLLKKDDVPPAGPYYNQSIVHFISLQLSCFPSPATAAYR